ncbi:hypothetical protein LWF15_12280 [Kineosporia rhizophila]|uniref:hypothetical protein n=1 Tax=Kineosporia TaxID=49184 RepID=UPI001E65A218|nr:MULTISPECIES: hypothetical protein [Kineosporia]MCE0536286.1 hypothetical protein [Kineosporia rhizophila]GLY15128.1 hypothetical protein Kisp01_21430 [Kineosporia sp. NBRC 101677]
MAQYVKVDVGLLETTATRLGQVANELTASRSAADHDAQVVANSDLAGALGDFSDNWRIRREDLIQAVTGAQKFVAGAATAYRQLDNSMAEALSIPEGGK